MTTFRALFCTTILLSLFACSESGDTSTATNSNLPRASFNNGGLQLPDGFVAAIVVDSIEGRVRHIAALDDNTLYVKLARAEDSLGIVALKDTDGNARPNVQEKFGDFMGTGIRIRNGYLYASSDNEVYRYKLSNGELVPGTPKEVIVADLPVQYNHEAKSIAFDDAGHLYVNIGAPSNACQENDREKGSPGMDPCPLLEKQGGIWRFWADSLNQTQDMGTRYATGLRNCVALAWNSAANSLYAVQHGRDQLHALYSELYDEKTSAILPAEEFIQISEGDDFGWPYCYYDQIQGKKVLGPEYGGDGTEVGRCADKKDPLIGFPGHMAPNDLLFYTGDLFPEKYRNGAFICFHGSWNRAPEPQGGYFVAFVPMKDGLPNGDWEIFADGFAQVDPIGGPGDAVHRPMGMSQGPDGSLYVSDSQKGTIWRIMYSGGTMASK